MRVYSMQSVKIMKCPILIPRPPLWAIPEKISKQGMGRGDGGDGEGDGG